MSCSKLWGHFLRAGDAPSGAHFEITFVGAFVGGGLLVPWVSQAGRLMSPTVHPAEHQLCSRPLSHQAGSHFAVWEGSSCCFGTAAGWFPQGHFASQDTCGSGVDRWLWPGLGCEFATVPGFPPAQD